MSHDQISAADLLEHAAGDRRMMDPSFFAEKARRGLDAAIEPAPKTGGPTRLSFEVPTADVLVSMGRGGLPLAGGAEKTPDGVTIASSEAIWASGKGVGIVSLEHANEPSRHATEMATEAIEHYERFTMFVGVAQSALTAITGGGLAGASGLYFSITRLTNDLKGGEHEHSGHEHDSGHERDEGDQKDEHGAHVESHEDDESHEHGESHEREHEEEAVEPGVLRLHGEEEVIASSLGPMITYSRTRNFVLAQGIAELSGGYFSEIYGGYAAGMCSAGVAEVMGAAKAEVSSLFMSELVSAYGPVEVAGSVVEIGRHAIKSGYKYLGAALVHGGVKPGTQVVAINGDAAVNLETHGSKLNMYAKGFDLDVGGQGLRIRDDEVECHVAEVATRLGPAGFEVRVPAVPVPVAVANHAVSTGRKVAEVLLKAIRVLGPPSLTAAAQAFARKDEPDLGGAEICAAALGGIHAAQAAATLIHEQEEAKVHEHGRDTECATRWQANDVASFRVSADRIESKIERPGGAEAVAQTMTPGMASVATGASSIVVSADEVAIRSAGRDVLHAGPPGDGVEVGRYLLVLD